MFERFTDRARRVVVLAQEEARLLNHNYIGTEHVLLGLIREEDGVAAQALESLGIRLEAVRQRIGETIGPGEQAPTGHISFTPQAKKVLELSLREALQLGHNYIGTEHILLGLIAEGHGVAAQVLTEFDADGKRVRTQVLKLLPGAGLPGAGLPGAGLPGAGLPGTGLPGTGLPGTGEDAPIPVPLGGLPGRRDRAQLAGIRTRLDALEARLSAIEGRAGTGPDEGAIDRELARIRADKAVAVGRQDYERAAQLRDEEQRLVESKKARQADWELAHPDLPTLAGKFVRLSAEVDRLREQLRLHGIEANKTDATAEVGDADGAGETDRIGEAGEASEAAG